jgi:predicted DNA-binding WGR domain protein
MSVEFDAETFEAMSWHDPRWAGDRENVERAFKSMYPTYTIEEDSIDYLIYQGGASNKFHLFFLATDPAGNYHSFNAYGRIGYTPTLHHNAGPGTKGSVTQAISKKRHQKSKKGYVQQAESSEEDWPKHECVTCAEGMDELVAKGQVWGCECCGLLVGTQDDHEYCGSNNNGFVMCNLCETEQCGEVCDGMSGLAKERKKMWVGDAEYDFQNQAITTIIADEEDEAYEIFARTYDPITEDWEVIDVREGEDYSAEAMNAETFEAENGFIFSDDYINYGMGKMYEEDKNEVRKIFLKIIKKYLSISGYPHISDDKITISLEMFDSGKWRGEAFIDAPISEMNAEEPEYETVELAKPVRTGWSIGAGLTLWTISVAAVTSLLLLGATKNGDE